MQSEYVKKLDFDSDTFADMKHDLNSILQKLLGNMTETETTEGSISLKIDVSFIRECIPNYDPAISGDTRIVQKPQFKHKITSAIKINDEKSGNMNGEMELVWSDEYQMYVMQPVANTEQKTIFDVDFYEVAPEPVVVGEPKQLPPQKAAALPEPSDDYDYEEPDGDDDEPYDVEDITDEFI